MKVKRKQHAGQPDKQEEELHRGGLVPGLHAAQDKLWQGEHVQQLRQAVRQAPQYRAVWLSIICRVFYETVKIFYFSCLAIGVGRVFSCDLRSIQWCVKSDCLLAVVHLTAGGEAHGGWVPRSTKQTGSSFLHAMQMFNRGCGLVCVNDVPFDWIWVCWFCTAHNEMWTVTMNCLSLTSVSALQLQRRFRITDQVCILCCCFELVGIWLSSSWCHVLGKKKGI